jgi:hypothetical protein
MHDLVERLYRDLAVTQDLGLGMILWMSLLPRRDLVEGAAGALAGDSRSDVDRSPGYFCREPGLPTVKFAFTNYGVSIGLQAIRAWSERVHARQQFVATYRSHDGYGRDAITHAMGVLVARSGRLLSWNRRLGRCRPGPRPTHLDAALLLLRSRGIPEPRAGCFAASSHKSQDRGSHVRQRHLASIASAGWRPVPCGRTGPPRDPGRR